MSEFTTRRGNAYKAWLVVGIILVVLAVIVGIVGGVEYGRHDDGYGSYISPSEAADMLMGIGPDGFSWVGYVASSSALFFWGIVCLVIYYLVNENAKKAARHEELLAKVGTTSTQPQSVSFPVVRTGLVATQAVNATVVRPFSATASYHSAGERLTLAVDEQAHLLSIQGEAFSDAPSYYPASDITSVELVRDWKVVAATTGGSDSADGSIEAPSGDMTLSGSFQNLRVRLQLKSRPKQPVVVWFHRDSQLNVRNGKWVFEQATRCYQTLSSLATHAEEKKAEADKAASAPLTIFVADELAKLGALLKDGLITRGEFEAQKKALLSASGARTVPTGDGGTLA